MKINFILLIILSTVIFSCGESKEQKENKALKAQIEKLKTENSELKSGDLKMKSSINEFNKFLKEIEANLASVDQNKTMIANLSGDMKDKKDTRANIKSQIGKIKELMENSKLKIIALDKLLAKLRAESGEKSTEILTLDKQVKSLTRDLLDKDLEIELLDDELEDMGGLYELELKKSAELWSIINRAFYLTGTSKELVQKGVITKEGGFIGLGKVKVMNVNSSDTLFNKIEKDATDMIALSAKKAKLISNHPEGSYSFEGGKDSVDKLVITDKKAFWKEGNYLVIELEK